MKIREDEEGEVKEEVKRVNVEHERQSREVVAGNFPVVLREIERNVNIVGRDNDPELIVGWDYGCRPAGGGGTFKVTESLWWTVEGGVEKRVGLRMRRVKKGEYWWGYEGR